MYILVAFKKENLLQGMAHLVSSVIRHTELTETCLPRSLKQRSLSVYKIPILSSQTLNLGPWNMKD